MDSTSMTYFKKRILIFDDITINGSCFWVQSLDAFLRNADKKLVDMSDSGLTTLEIFPDCVIWNQSHVLDHVIWDLGLCVILIN